MHYRALECKGFLLQASVVCLSAECACMHVLSKVGCAAGAAAAHERLHPAGSGIEATGQLRNLIMSHVQALQQLQELHVTTAVFGFSNGAATMYASSPRHSFTALRPCTVGSAVSDACVQQSYFPMCFRLSRFFGIEIVSYQTSPSPGELQAAKRKQLHRRKLPPACLLASAQDQQLLTQACALTR